MGGEPLRAFTAIGRIVDRDVYSFDMGGGFVPFRRDVQWGKARHVALSAISSELEFTQSNWGLLARRGHFEISLHDFRSIARAMSSDHV